MDLELLVLLPFKYISLLESLVIIFPLLVLESLIWNKAGKTNPNANPVMCQEVPSLVPKVLRACPDSWCPWQPHSLRGATYPLWLSFQGDLGRMTSAEEPD